MAYTKRVNNDLQVLQNSLNRLLIRKWDNRPTEELCEETGSLSVQQIIAYSSMVTAFKIIRSKKPTYLYSKFNLNDRGTAFLQTKKKSRTCEGFVERSVKLLNRFGVSNLQSIATESQFKKRIKAWVKENIEVKPKKSEKAVRFNGCRVQTDVDQEFDQQTEINRQRRITDFFSRC